MFYTINFKRKKKAKNIYVNQQRAFGGEEDCMSSVCRLNL